VMGQRRSWQQQQTHARNPKKSFGPHSETSR
jgi:hypothetical protein